jgi:putative endonuclease
LRFSLGEIMPLAGLTRWPVWRRWFGARAERAAAKFLRNKKLRVLFRNVTLPGGELDIVALDGRMIVFVEVRSTEGIDCERPTGSVDDDKQRKLTELATAFLQRHNLLGHASRFDVVAVSWPANHREPSIVHFPNAFAPIGQFQMFS